MQRTKETSAKLDILLMIDVDCFLRNFVVPNKYKKIISVEDTGLKSSSLEILVHMSWSSAVACTGEVDSGL